MAAPFVGISECLLLDIGDALCPRQRLQGSFDLI